MMCNIILRFFFFFSIQAPTKFAYFRPNCQSAASKALTLSTVITFRGARVQCRYERRCPAKCIFCFLIKMQTHIFRLRMKKLYTANVHPSNHFFLLTNEKHASPNVFFPSKEKIAFFFVGFSDKNLFKYLRYDDMSKYCLFLSLGLQIWSFVSRKQNLFLGLLGKKS